MNRVKMSCQSPRDAISEATSNGHQSVSNQIVRMNSGANDLDELFKAVQNPQDSLIPLSVPMRQRKLPASFFKQPDGPNSASHSRESSLDASFSPPPLSQPSNSPLSPASPQQQQTIQHHMSAVPSGLTISHPRAHSSPASLQQTLAVSQAMASAQQSSHIRQYSFDVDSIPLPQGWEMGKTESGERYFINHITKTTQWEDPRRKVIQQQLQQQTQPRVVVIPQNNTNTSNNANNNSTGNLNQGLGPFPTGWEPAQTPSGDIYFINHVESKTTWIDPRLPPSAQQNRAQLNNGRTPPPPFTRNAVPPSLVTALQNMNTSGSTNTDNIRLQQQQRLMSLELERQKLRQRQSEILSGRLPPISSTGIDPFLGGNNSAFNNDCHSRQESGDSGLGLGSNYSLPHTPEDFLNIEDALNNTEDANNNINRSNDLGLEGLNVGNLDLVSENMESDDLIPTLTDDFGTDILSIVEEQLDTNRLSIVEEQLDSNDNNIMTWL
ncbi:transcriptional coactivator YAP1-A-like [Oppia nitens]|uniref:transcriptional coactivator YAP1-A-like n=1 Tax=Oppia nitens TaxID=1686743 RepID=UPI0023D9D8E3|nr:transcriptional coactivator YAP1-A-like [Oppia nitens]XP_054161873.1 transcriptional coactivator YAP1-A-like [Oppia nitens]